MRGQFQSDRHICLQTVDSSMHGMTQTMCCIRDADSEIVVTVTSYVMTDVTATSCGVIRHATRHVFSSAR